jgi:hypothetical protein
MKQPIDSNFRRRSVHLFGRLHKVQVHRCLNWCPHGFASRLGIIKLYGTAQDSARNQVGVEACQLHVYCCLRPLAFASQVIPGARKVVCAIGAMAVTMPLNSRSRLFTVHVAFR